MQSGLIKCPRYDTAAIDKIVMLKLFKICVTY